jgi:diguanylate cyclase (GGDEF)-like protein
MFFAKFQLRTAPISDSIYIEVIATLYGTPVPIFVAGVCQAIVGTISVAQTGDVFTAVLTILGVIVALVRLLVVWAFRRESRRKAPLNRSELIAWEWSYAAGTFTTALLLGLFSARGLFVGDATCLVMAVGLAFGFGAGIVARLSLRPVVAFLDLCAVGLPSVAATLLMQRDVPHIAMGLMFLIFIVAGFEMVRLSYNSTLNQMTLKQKFEQLARIDPLTGLLNRSVLAADLERIVANSDGAMVAVQTIDLDHFKVANDRYGHPVGDALLKQVAARLVAAAGSGDLIIRMGGDEFVLAQKSVASPDDAELMVQRIFQSITAPYHVEGHEIVIGASIGIALSPEDGKTVEALLARSDAALYRAKESRGGYAFASTSAKSQGREHAA